MEKDKSRGVKHIKDKKKYKGNSLKNPKYVPPKSKPKLESNWDRYEISEESEGHKLSKNTDFALLSNAPISVGSHFQFKSDKIAEEDNLVEENLFCLNLDLLNMSLLTIPFYERLDISKEYFKDHEIKRMDKNAEDNLVTYKTFLKKVVFVDTSDIMSAIVPPVNDTMIDKTTTMDESENNIIHLIESCSLGEDIKDIQRPASTKPENDLEQWLDDILED